MGVLYSAFPIDSRTRDWLCGDGIACPEVDGRWPTPNDIAAVLNALDGFASDYTISPGVWQAEVSDTSDPEHGMWTVVCAPRPTGPDDPCEFCFEKGWPQLAAQILRQLSLTTGPFVLVPDTGCPGLVIEETTDLRTALNAWEHLGNDKASQFDP